jgi:hypothetical protein
MGERRSHLDDPIPEVDPGAVRGALGLTVGPAAFLVHFAAVYGVGALACAFGFSARTVLGLGIVPAFTAVATAVAVVAVLWVAHRVPDRSTEGRADRQYDQPARAEFVAKMRVMISWLAAAGMLWVAIPVFLARPCG